MAEWFVGPIMEKLISTCSDYLQDQFRWQTGMKKELERLQENHPKIQAVVSAATQAQIIDQNSALNKWIWQLRDDIDEAEDLLDEFEYLKHEQHLKNSFQSLLFGNFDNLCRVGERALQIDPYMNKLQEVVKKLDRVSAEVSPFLYLIESTKQVQREQQVELHKTHETGSLPTNDLIGRGEVKEFVIQWLRNPSNEEHQTHVSTTKLYNNISLLSVVGHGGMGKTALLQHVYEEDEIKKEFTLKIWVCVSNNFDVKKVIGDMLESLTKKKHDLETLHALQESLKSEVISKKFLLVLDDIWEEDEELDKREWEKVVAPLAGGGLGSKILITTRMESVASTIAKLIKKKKDVLRLKGLQEDDCLQLLLTHAFADVDNPDDQIKLRNIAGELVKKLFGSPLAAKVMGGALNSSLDERHWRKMLNNNLGQNDIFPILKLSYIFLPTNLQNCFAFCSIYPQDYEFHKNDLVRQNIVNLDLDERVFHNLQPHKYLKELVINNYMGVRSAIWMNQANMIDNLEKIELSNCLEWQILPPFGQLPFLKILTLANMPKVKRLDDKFPSLEKLHIYELEALEDWFDARVGCLFPRLTNSSSTTAQICKRCLICLLSSRRW